MLVLIVLLALCFCLSYIEFHQLDMSIIQEYTLAKKIKKEKLDLNINTVYYRKRYNLED